MGWSAVWPTDGLWRSHPETSEENLVDGNGKNGVAGNDEVSGSRKLKGCSIKWLITGWKIVVGNGMVCENNWSWLFKNGNSKFFVGSAIKRVPLFDIKVFEEIWVRGTTCRKADPDFWKPSWDAGVVGIWGGDKNWFSVTVGVYGNGITGGTGLLFFSLTSSTDICSLWFWNLKMENYSDIPKIPSPLLVDPQPVRLGDKPIEPWFWFYSPNVPFRDGILRAFLATMGQCTVWSISRCRRNNTSPERDNTIKLYWAENWLFRPTHAGVTPVLMFSSVRSIRELLVANVCELTDKRLLTSMRSFVCVQVLLGFVSFVTSRILRKHGIWGKMESTNITFLWSFSSVATKMAYQHVERLEHPTIATLPPTSTFLVCHVFSINVFNDSLKENDTRN